MDVKTSVLERYSEGAKERQESLCCPVDYDISLLKLLPEEIVEKDYGCGDPSRYVEAGDVVLDLGSGGGKICYMAAQLVGAEGKVIGVDMNDDMLDLARRHLPDMTEKLGGATVEFRKGHIQDLALNLDAVETYIKRNPIETLDDYEDFESWKRSARHEDPMIKDSSVSLVVSNCVLNLVANEDRMHMISEIFRVLKPGGRVAISDIISDEPVPEQLQKDPHLWSGCISGAFEEKAFIQAFRDAGFIGISYDKWDAEPWQVVDGIEFRSVTLTAYKPVATAALDGGQAVIYKGPFKEVYDDYGRVYRRGDRVAVSERFFENLTGGAYKDEFIGVQPQTPPAEKSAFCASPGTLRSVKETKGGTHGSGSGGGCC